MKNVIKRILFSILFLAMFIIAFVNKDIKVYAFNNYELEKIFCNATLSDDFSDNEVLIILNKQLSRDLSYNVSFENIDYICIEDLTDSYDKECELNEHFRRIYKMTLRDSNKEKVLSTIKQLEALDFIYCAEPNYYDKVASVPNDYISSIQYAIENINLPDTWDFMVGNNDVTVGVIDTGIDGNNPDLQDNLNIDLSRSFSADFTSALEDFEGHGTHVAGIIGAVGNNNVGITGTNWNVSIVSLRVANSIGDFPIDNVIAAINYAHEDDVNIDILNYSGGGYNYNSRVETRRQAIANYDGLFVCAAGNDKINTDVNLHYPSSHNLSNLISVGSLDQNNNRSKFSNYGLNTVNIYAPGNSILSTYPIHICNEYYEFSDGTLLCELDRTLVRILKYEIETSEEPIDWDYIDENFADIVYPYIIGDVAKDEVVPDLFNVAEHLNTGYHYTDGTSMSTPYVAGVAALLLSLNKELTATQLRQAILESAEEITITVPDTTEGAVEGDTVNQDVLKLNAYEAVKYVLENYMNPTTYTLSNYSSTINTNKTIASDASYFDELNGFYKLNVTYAKSYEFISSSGSGIEVTLYDENFTEIPYNDLDSTSNKVHFIENLSTGTYYLRTKYANEESTGTINTQIVSRTTAYISVGDNDILLNTHNYNKGIYPSNNYYYINSRGVGFYRFTLTGIKADGTEVTYPSSAIMIKDHMDEDIIDKYSLTGYSNQAISGYNENSFVAYLNATGYFYVYIDIDTEGLKSLTLNIEPVEREAIDLFTKSESTNSSMEILDFETTKGDYVKKIILKQTGKFTIDYSYSGLQNSNILFILSKLNYNSTTQTYSIETIISQLMNATNDSFTYEINLTEGTYFVGYFNKDDNSAFNVILNRLISQSGSYVLIPDPDCETDGGSQVEVYEKNLLPSDRSYRETNIVIGFTRVIYLDYHYVTQTSRNDYYWYSSNEAIATVSQHGTVYGKSAGTVKIMAVNKNNPSIVFVKQFTIIRDTKSYTEVIYNEIKDKHKLSEGEYQLGLTVQNSPYPMAQYYTWRIISKDDTITSVSIDQWGNVTITGTGNIVIEGYDYIYNENYGVRINVTVTN